MLPKFLVTIEPPECCSWQQQVLRAPTLCPEFMQRSTAQCTVAHNALRFRAVDNLPRFADAHSWGQTFAELHLESSAAPDSLHEKRLENDGLCEIGADHRC